MGVLCASLTLGARCLGLEDWMTQWLFPHKAWHFGGWQEGPGWRAPRGLLESARVFCLVAAGSCDGESRSCPFSPGILVPDWPESLLPPPIGQNTHRAHPLSGDSASWWEGFRYQSEAIFAGNPHSPPLTPPDPLAWWGCRERQVPPMRCQQDVWALRSLILLKTNKQKWGWGGGKLGYPSREQPSSHSALRSDWEAAHTG